MSNKFVLNLHDKNGNCLSVLADQAILNKIFDNKNPFLLKK